MTYYPISHGYGFVCVSHSKIYGLIMFIPLGGISISSKAMIEEGLLMANKLTNSSAIVCTGTSILARALKKLIDKPSCFYIIIRTLVFF